MVNGIFPVTPYTMYLQYLQYLSHAFVHAQLPIQFYFVTSLSDRLIVVNHGRPKSKAINSRIKRYKLMKCTLKTKEGIIHLIALHNMMKTPIRFLQRAAMLALPPQCSHCKHCISYGNSVGPSVCPSVRLSHAGIVSKRRHVARWSFHRWIAKCV